MSDNDRLLIKTQLARCLAVSPRTIDWLDATRDLPRPILAITSDTTETMCRRRQ